MSGAAREPRLLVVDPAVRRPALEGVEVVLQGWPGSSRVLRPALEPGQLLAPGDLDGADGVVLLGSAASVNDDLPWLPPLGAWLDPLLDGTLVVPLLAICFGHQFLAARAGGEVGFASEDRSVRLGIEPSEFRGSQLLPGVRRLTVVSSHREVVTRAPEGFTPVARRAGLACDALEHRALPLFSVQFHPEARRRFLRDHRLEATDEQLAAVAADGDELLNAFRERVLESAGVN
ncbi:MAG: gamma-glutamyl-gamma-aminobutyrate hydrolase family protein [Acidobacteria bacterium]|nr:gamma-glutamyl-gamma-aminobutyrate hydrolase family protein [Acidobacteriota bacterium]